MPVANEFSLNALAETSQLLSSFEAEPEPDFGSYITVEHVLVEVSVNWNPCFLYLL